MMAPMLPGLFGPDDAASPAASTRDPWAVVPPPAMPSAGEVVVAGIGSRELTPDEIDRLETAGAWCARRGFHLRSGGAVGADQAWARGWARVAAPLVSVCLPEDSPQQRRRVPAGARIEVGPWPGWMTELAVAEVELKARLPRLGLPPYTDPAVAAIVAARKGWRWMKSDPKRAFWIDLFTRNVAIVCASNGRRADIVLGMLNPKNDGGGTGRAFRIAQALEIPTFDLRDPQQAAAARAALETLASRGQRPAGPGQPRRG